jgi:quercetin dioxygenase-like cupin family protein
MASNPTTPYFISPNLLADDVMPPKGILSQTLHNDDQVKVILFHFAAGNELTAHTAPFPADLYFVRGRGRLTLGEDSMPVEAGAFAHMTAHLTHGIVALEPLVMLLVMMKGLKEVK